MLRQAHYPRMVFRISRTTTVRRSPLPDVVADAYAHVPPGASHNSSFLQSRCGVSGRIFASHRRRRWVVVAAVAFRRGRDAINRVSTIVWPCFCASCVPVCQSPLRRVCHLRLRLASMMPAASAAAAVAMSVAGVAVRVFTSDDDACLCSTSILTVSWRVCHRSTVLDRHRVTVSPMTTTTESLTLTLSATVTVASLSAVCAVVVAVVRCVAHDAAVMAASAAMAVTAWRTRVRRRSTGIPLSIRRV